MEDSEGLSFGIYSLWARTIRTIRAEAFHFMCDRSIQQKSWTLSPHFNVFSCISACLDIRTPPGQNFLVPPSFCGSELTDVWAFMCHLSSCSSFLDPLCLSRFVPFKELLGSLTRPAAPTRDLWPHILLSVRSFWNGVEHLEVKIPFTDEQAGMLPNAESCQDETLQAETSSALRLQLSLSLFNIELLLRSQHVDLLPNIPALYMQLFIERHKLIHTPEVFYISSRFSRRIHKCEAEGK